MIKPGDIVFRKYKGGIRNNKPDESIIGLVIKEHEREAQNIVPQFYVRFGEENPKWYYQHELFKIQWRK